LPEGREGGISEPLIRQVRIESGEVLPGLAMEEMVIEYERIER